MLNISEIINECLTYESEREWFGIKENWFEKDQLGEYISSLSNSAAILGKPFAYMIWGVNDATHKIVGTSFDYNIDINNEPLQHYLARNLNPSIGFYFQETAIDNKRVVLLTIPAAKIVPTAYKDIRYIRIGSSKENIRKYPEREAYLFSALTFGISTINTKESEYQDLTFNQLKTYYASKNIFLNDATFLKNLHLLTKDNKFNIMAQLLSDNSHVPIRVAVFDGKTKASKMYSVKEFGYKCLLFSLNEVLTYGEVLNVPQANETNRIMEREEIMLFDFDAFREAIINAFLHNEWINLNEPMITVYSNRIEVLSRGTLAPLQTINGFYEGHSIPVNDKLSELFLQLHISEKNVKGVPIIISKYSKKSIKINDNSIIVTIPFTRINELDKNVGDKVVDKTLNSSQIKVLAEIKNNPNITKPQLSTLCNLGKTSIDNNISKLKLLGYIKREGLNKTGYWEVLK
ncbi:MAG: putative DNA binding domain-containing protein [Bacilli bacterium]|nr:putative DNA binding domain-containing protein [Bacilli bacterium]